MNEHLTNINTFPELIDFAAQKYGEQTVMQIRRRVKIEKVNYSQLPHLVKQTITYLKQQGLRSEDKVLIWGLNCPEYVVLLLACFSSGIVPVPIDFRTKEDVIGKIIKQTQPKLLATSLFLDPTNLKKQVPKTITIEGLFEAISELKESDYHADLPELSEILYTSGTTGIPKGVMIDQRQVVAISKYALAYIPQLKQYQTLSILPLSHVLEQIIGTAVAILLGSKTTYLTRINSVKMVQAMAEFKPSYLVVVPQLLSVFWNKIELTAKQAGKFDLLLKMNKLASHLPRFLQKRLFKKVHATFGGNIKFLACSGAPLSGLLAERFSNMGFNLIEVYGATEVLAVTINNTSKIVNTVGKPLPIIEVKTAADGEILIKGPFTTAGYFKNPQKNKEAFTDGWYHTGDIGDVGKDNYLRIKGRDSFKLVLQNGENIYVEDLETIINQHPQVKDSCVVGLDDSGADKIHALIIRKQDAILSTQAIIEEINSGLSSKQQILSFEDWLEEDFPRTHTLKIDRKRLKQMLQHETNAETQATPEQSSQTSILEIIAHLSKKDIKQIKPTQSLTSDLGMDSLARAELTAMIEDQLGVVIDNLQINETTTVQDVQQLAQTSSKAPPDHLVTRNQYTRMKDILRIFIFKLFIFPLHALLVPKKVTNPAALKAIPQQAIIAFNHPGWLDFFTVMRSLGIRSTRAVGLASHEFWASKPLAKVLELGGSFPIDQTGNNLLRQLQILDELSQEDRLILIAPQGTMQRGEQQDPFKTGVAVIAQELDLPVINIKLENYEKILPPPPEAVKAMTKLDWLKTFIPKSRTTVKVTVGEALYSEIDESPAAFTKRIETEFKKL